MIRSDRISLSSIKSSGPAIAGLSHDQRPIAALASAPGSGAVSIIRLSGTYTFEALSLCIDLDSVLPREMTLAGFKDPESRDVVDQLMVCFFVAPRSFTGENSAELYCHGGSYIVQRILGVLYKLGCRPADPGEFTKRAFLNGKMDLTAAEGVRELVEASTHQQWLAARQLATGRLGLYIEDLRKDVVGAMAYLEARIDFPDEGDTQGVELDHVRSRIAEVSKQLDCLADSFDSGRVASSGLTVAILGAPNMGKSSLMNALLDKERAIVTDIAGTTRDYLEERCLVKGRLIKLVDTAGIRETTETVEQIGVQAAINLAKDADVIITLASVQATPEELQYFSAIMESIPSDKCIAVINKLDLMPDIERHPETLYISCETGEGLDHLRLNIASRVDHHVDRLRDEPFITSARHKLAIDDAKSYLDKFFSGLDEGLYEEMLAFELQHAVRSLSSIIGDVDHDDLLERIFSEFCVGK